MCAVITLYDCVNVSGCHGVTTKTPPLEAPPGLRAHSSQLANGSHPRGTRRFSLTSLGCVGLYVALYLVWLFKITSGRCVSGWLCINRFSPLAKLAAANVSCCFWPHISPQLQIELNWPVDCSCSLPVRSRGSFKEPLPV